ncbi:unnamed protein product, partial [Mesorhabditis spiculigera]
MLHIPQIALHHMFWGFAEWEPAMDALLALLEALLVQCPPAGGMTRLLYYSLDFIGMPSLHDMAVVFRLPERLLTYLERPDIRSRGDVQIFSHGRLKFSCHDTQENRWKQARFLVTIAQNYGNRRGQLYAEQRHRAEPNFNEYTLEWSNY